MVVIERMLVPFGDSMLTSEKSSFEVRGEGGHLVIVFLISFYYDCQYCAKMTLFVC